jgi:hypothetical protein
LLSPDADIVAQIGVGQYCELEEVFGLVVEALEDRGTSLT